jgi:hypothetical protein
MTVNSLSPGFIKLYYIGAQNIQHIMTIPVAIADIGVTPATIHQKDLTSVSWVAGITAYVTVLKAEMPTTTTFQYAELWSMPTPTSDPVFVSTVSLSIVGTKSGAAVSNSQIVFSFRSSCGGVGKVYLLEGNEVVNSVFKAPAYGDAGKLGVVNYLIGSSGIVVARDGCFPVNIPRILTKTNDPMRKKTVLGAP